MLAYLFGENSWEPRENADGRAKTARGCLEAECCSPEEAPLDLRCWPSGRPRALAPGLPPQPHSAAGPLSMHVASARAPRSCPSVPVTPCHAPSELSASCLYFLFHDYLFSP